MRIRLFRTLFVSVIALLPLTAAQANGWERLPNGEWGFTTQLTTSGMFTCLNAQYYGPGGSCSANGNALVLTSGQSTMTVQFSGLTQSILATNVRSEPLTLGTLTKSFTGGPFTIPPMLSQQAELFRFSLLLASPTGVQSPVNAGYTASNRTSLPYNCCEDYSTYTSLFLTARPPGITYSVAILDNFAGRDINFDTTPSIVTARIGLVPEPSTYLLMASGLTVIGLLSGRRRTSAQRHDERAAF